MTVLVVGEALVDLIVSSGGSVTAVPGGGPFNTARTIARLGTPVQFGGRLSNDAFGRQLARMLADDGVATPLPIREALLTTLALAELDELGAATYRFYTEGTAAPAVDVGDIAVDSDVRIVSIGTLGLVLEPLATAAEDVVTQLPESVLLVLDPNCRPSTVSDAAGYRERVRRLVARADVVKVSGDDLAYLQPGTDLFDAARSLLVDGARLVLFTDGAASVHAMTSEWEIEVSVPRVDVADTVGAGDAFGGAFIAWWHNANLGRHDLADSVAVHAAVERAVEVAGITCTRAGANPPRASELSQ